MTTVELPADSGQIADAEVRLELPFAQRQMRLRLNDPADHIQARIARFVALYEEEMIIDMAARTPPGSTFIDVGAYIGTHAIALALGPAQEVIAFEPSAKAFANLELNVGLNELEGQVRLHRAALATHRSEAWLTTPDSSNRGHSFLSGRPLRQSDERVECYSLDEVEIHGRVGCIKIDVEGKELDVLRGAVETIARHAPVLYVEVADVEGFDQVTGHLRESGYFPARTFNFTPTCLYLRQDQFMSADAIDLLSSASRREVAAAVRIRDLEHADRPRRELIRELRLRLMEFEDRELAASRRNR